jgi:hypothetical protein
MIEIDSSVDNNRDLTLAHFVQNLACFMSNLTREVAISPTIICPFSHCCNLRHWCCLLGWQRFFFFSLLSLGLSGFRAENDDNC